MIEQIENSFRLNCESLERLILGLDDTTSIRQPVGVANHPAWIVGHLAHSMEAIGGEMGLPPWLPAGWSDAFGTGSEPANDAAPLSRSILELRAGQEKVTARLMAMTAAEMSAPLPDTRHRSTFPSVGHAVVHILCAHFAIHLGQLSV